ncbi:TraV family lipoprotein [Sphingopyxis alaskensis]|uniref:TraV family lipoprotein n=1 Tax=Sphingopyxis alaskensis TaxID=117207 RepID=UPI002040A917|nr:TraV family lipoprotein [Sphingopyxis alaskensis]MCM3420966.1 TraV family lipoprotein [Sphingopyxis alaskensis]
MFSGRSEIARLAIAAVAVALLSGCATVGSMMSPYSEKFDCKNSDHGQCIHPERAYEDAVAGVTSKSDPAVTRAKAMLKDAGAKGRARGIDAYGSYKDSVYRELKGLIEAPVTPMLKPARTVRTLILPYADRQRPDRLYMPRYIYSVLDRPVWVVGDMLISSPSRAASARVLGQVRETAEPAPDISAAPAAPVGEPQ